VPFLYLLVGVLLGYSLRAPHRQRGRLPVTRLHPSVSALTSPEGEEYSMDIQLSAPGNFRMVTFDPKDQKGKEEPFKSLAVASSDESFVKATAVDADDQPTDDPTALRYKVQGLTPGGPATLTATLTNLDGSVITETYSVLQILAPEDVTLNPTVGDEQAGTV